MPPLPRPDPTGGWGAYVHVPFCRRRCPYCGFTVFVEAEPPYGRWAEGVRLDWEDEAASFPGLAHSVYFGGGTPSLAPPDTIRDVLAAIPRAPGAEVTLEANPGTVDARKLDDFAAAGVDRLSLGVQSFHPATAQRLSRGHGVREARELARTVAAGGFRSWSVDVIFAVPGQSEGDFAADLAAILDLEPPHVSLYGLEVHAGTPFARARDEGRLVPVDAEAWRAMYDLATDTLEAGGWRRYEVSNFAREGHRARHNDAVWRGGWYAGLGPASHGFRPDGTRTVRADRLDAWLARAPPSVDRPGPREAAVDRVLSTLRHVDGLDLRGLAAGTGMVVDLHQLRHLSAAGLLAHVPPHLRLTPAGFPVADGIVAAVCRALVAGVSPTFPAGPDS